MEDPLLPSGSGRRGGRGESSSLGGHESGALNNVLVGRRGEAITKGNNFQKAAAMVDQVSYCSIACFGCQAPVLNENAVFFGNAPAQSFSNFLLHCRNEL